MTAKRRPSAPKHGSREGSWLAVAAHPLRVRILWRFLEGTDVVLTPTAIAREFGATVGGVSYHVRELHQNRILQLVRKVQRRGAFEHHYRLRDPERVAAALWGLSARLLRVADPDARGPGDATVVVDATGLAEIRALTDRYLADVAEISRQARTRVDEHPTSGEATAPGTPPADWTTYRVAIVLGVDDER